MPVCPARVRADSSSIDGKPPFPTIGLTASTMRIKRYLSGGTTGRSCGLRPLRTWTTEAQPMTKLTSSVRAAPNSPTRPKGDQSDVEKTLPATATPTASVATDNKAMYSRAPRAPKA